MNERNDGAVHGYSPAPQAQQYPQQYQPQPFQAQQYPQQYQPQQQYPQQYQQAQPVQQYPQQQHQPQQPANTVVYERYATAEQITEKRPKKKKKGCLAKLLTWGAGILALVFVMGIVGAANTDSPASVTKKPAPAAQNTQAAAAALAQTAEPVKSSETMSQRNALDSAKAYLRFMTFSRQGLIVQLEYEQYSHEDAVYAVDRCGADWNEQAVKQAKSYLEISAHSYSGLVGQLEYEGFTHEQAVHGVDNCGADWNEQAVKSAKSYLEISSFSRQGLIDQLKYEGFTDAQAEYGVTGAGY